MRNKIIPIILIFVMNLSSSVFASDRHIYNTGWNDNYLGTNNIRMILNHFDFEDYTDDTVNAIYDAFITSYASFKDLYPNVKLYNLVFWQQQSIASSYTGLYYSVGNVSGTFTDNSIPYISIQYSRDGVDAIKWGASPESTGTTNKQAYFGGSSLITYQYTIATDNFSVIQNNDSYYIDGKIFSFYDNHNVIYRDNWGVLTNALPGLLTAENIYNQFGNSSGNGTTPDVPNYDYTGNDYWENHNKPYFSYSHLDGYMNASEEKPDYLDSLSYSGKYYFNLPFYIFNDPLSTYDFTHDTLRLGVYNVTNESGENKYKLLDYFDASAGAVYITGETDTDLYGGWDRYMYDLFALYNYNGKLDNFIDTYGKNGLAFRLFLYTPFNEEVANTYYIVLNGDLISAGTNNPTQDIVFDENAGFFELLESSKSFISRFLSFFDIFPSWLTSLLATAITVAIICRLIGR